MEITLKYRCIELNCVFNITEYIEEKLYGDDAHPAEGGDIEDLQIFVGGVDIYEIFESSQIDYIKELIYDNL